MSRTRLLVMGLVALILLSLVGWQYHRLKRIEACIAEGKVWNGPQSRCDPPRPGPILERDLKRT